MTDSNEKVTERFVVICVEDEADVRESLMRDVHRICGSLLDVEACSTADEARALVDELEREQVRVPLILADHLLPGSKGADFLIELQGRPWFRDTGKVLVSGRTTMEDLTRALNAGALNGNVTKPWQFEELRDTVRHLLTEYFVQNAPDSTESVAAVLDLDQLTHAFTRLEERYRTLGGQFKRLQRSFLADFDIPDEDVEAAMIESVYRVLGNPKEEGLPAGTVLLREGQAIDGIYILLSGHARLSRNIGGEEHIFHMQTVGRIIGLLSLSLGGTSSFDCKAVTDIEVIRLSLEELDRAMQGDPMLSVHFITVLLRSLARRNRRAMELRLEVDELSKHLERERDQLAETLQQLEQAQMLLVETEKMATLGQLAAGVAHELNNPIAAIRRASAFLVEDLRGLMGSHPDSAVLGAMLDRGLTQAPLSTREERAQRTRLAEELGDRELARHLVEIGILSRDEFEQVMGSLDPAGRRARLAELKQVHGAGKSLRNISTCSERITALVKSLRSYARAGQQTPEAADLHEGLDETILLFGSELREVQVERTYAEVPHVACIAGEINQVWTNLISNALQAMEGKGTLRIETDQPEPGKVRVRITDNGPGIPEENLDRIFDVNFTTRQGRAEFGLGIGLPICHDIVNRHGGEMHVDSRPGQTCFSVVLPVEGPSPEHLKTDSTQGAKP